MDLQFLSSHIFPTFFPTGNLLRATRLDGGHIHRTVRVEWEMQGQRAEAVFQRLNPEIFPDPELLAENNRLIAGHLEGKGYPRAVLRPLETPEGKAVVWAPDGLWRAFPYLANTYTHLFPTEVEEVRKAATAIGEWHTYLKDFDSHQIRAAIPGFFDVEKRWQQWGKACAEAIPERMERAASEITSLESNRQLVNQFLDLQRENSLPLRILHGDPKLSNLLFDQHTKEVRALIDWDTVQPGWIVFDFGDMVRAYANPCAEDEPDPEKTSIHPPFLDALLEGFFAQTQNWLTSAERDNLFLGAQWVIWMQALRFLADYLTGDRYYPVQYETHNLVRARNQLRLLERFEFLAES
ncbi:MAG: aminoglycoside phosphotransferase family protein [Saprospirales bacterium]|nr:aminoglycoside phosphotransferase family protein [Saprospirales bacterium]